MQGSLLGMKAFPSLRLNVKDVLPQQTPEDDYNCGIGVVAAVGIILRDVIGVNQDDNLKFVTIFSKKTLISPSARRPKNKFVHFLRILSKCCHPLRRCQFLERLNNLAPDWRNRIISVTTDGASRTTGHYCGDASRFGNAALSGFYRVWCALHQHDLVLPQLYYSLCDDSFVGTVSLMTGHQQRQPDCRDGIKVSTICQHSS